MTRLEEIEMLNALKRIAKALEHIEQVVLSGQGFRFSVSEENDESLAKAVAKHL